MTDPVETVAADAEKDVAKVEVAAKDAVSAAQHIKSEIEKLGSGAKTLEVRVIAEVKSAWSRLDLWIVGFGGAASWELVTWLFHKAFH